MPRKIKFIENWNNKLDNKIFSTIRKHTDAKEIYYNDCEGMDFDLILKNKKYGDCVLIGISVKEWHDLRNNFGMLLVLDTGLYFQEAVKVFRKFYKEFPEHQKFIILIFDRVK